MIVAIRNKIPDGATPEYLRYRRKADQEWEMAGLAWQDGDPAAERRHIAQAREYERLAREALE